MTWQEICKIYPQQWLLVEAIKARSHAGKRILEQLSVINMFTDSISAMTQYKNLKRESPERELFVFHTSKKELDITERRWIGIRGINEYPNAGDEMKKKITRCGVMPFEQFKEKTIQIARGEYKPGKNEPKIWFESIKAMTQVLSMENMMLLRLIDETKPDTITDLACTAGRKESSLSRILKNMEKYGIVELKKEKQHIKPIVKATDFHIEFGISRL